VAPDYCRPTASWAEQGVALRGVPIVGSSALPSVGRVLP